MSSKAEKHRVDMVRIQSHAHHIITYEDNVTVHFVYDGARQLVYLCIEHNGKRIFMQDCNMLCWVQESSLDGVATIRSSNATVIILYDKQNESSANFFRNLQESLSNKSRETTSFDGASSVPDPGQLESMIDQLVQSISSGNSDNAGCIALQLADLRAKVQFKLSDRNGDEAKSIAKSISNADIQRSSNSLLQLTVHIECLSRKDPIIVPIEVLFGTTLRSLKNEIKNKTGIKPTDQYWFAFKQYLISDDYAFGSLVSFIPNGNQRTSLGNAIRSGDTLVMYIAQSSSYC